MTILESQVPVQLIEPFFYLDEPMFKHFQFHHQIFAFVQFESLHFEVVALAETTCHQVLMILHITGSIPI